MTGETYSWPLDGAQKFSAGILVGGLILSLAIHISAFLHLSWALNRNMMRISIAIVGFYILMHYFRGYRVTGATRAKGSRVAKLLRPIVMSYIAILGIGGAFVGTIAESGVPLRPTFTLYPLIFVSSGEYDFISVIVFSGMATCLYLMLLVDNEVLAPWYRKQPGQSNGNGTR